MKVFVEGREVTVRELTVGETRAWFADFVQYATQLKQQQLQQQQLQQDALSLVLFEEISLRDISMLTDLPAISIEPLHLTSLKQLVQAIIAVNPEWYDLRKRLMAMGEKAAAKALVPV